MSYNISLQKKLQVYISLIYDLQVISFESPDLLFLISLQVTYNKHVIPSTHMRISCHNF